MDGQLIVDKPHEITWQELKDFCNSLSDSELPEKVNVITADNVYSEKMNQPFRLQEDIYIDNFNEYRGTIKELKEWYEGDDEFDEEQCKIVTKKGTPFLWMDGI